MSSLSPKDRVSLCQFTFSDGRRCRSPRFGNHPRLCPDHAQKEARARARQSLGKDLGHYFSGDYLSACDLSTALGCLIPAVIRGDVKPKIARTVAYMTQTLLQAIHLSKHEYINAFDTDDWRQSIRNSINNNHNYRFPQPPHSEQPESPQLQPQVAPPQNQPPQPASQPAEASANCHCDAVAQAFRPEEPAASSNSSLATHHLPLPHAPSPHTPLPPTSAEFIQHVVAGLQTGSLAASPHVQPAPPNPQLVSPPPKSAVLTTIVAPPISATQSAPSAAPISQPVPSSPIQSSTAAPHSPQQQSPPKPHPPVAATLSAPRQEPRPAAGTQTGPSGLPVLAALPPRKPGAAPACGFS